ncbi:MAG TPA: carboxypeptidase-like regulatory domain-containing protein [Bryobacteraceae bacterium]|nr:carboxypeptidase-like regulatory domain-containing protein [Bryobacteraceae bacterium]
MRSLYVAALLFAASFAAFAQSDRGTITGTITDPGGAVVPNASIEAKNTGTDAVYPAASSSTGNYTIGQLPAGNYELTVTVSGFKKFVRPNLQVEVAGTLRVDAAMEIGAATESVTVTEAAPLLKTEGGEVSSNVSTSTLNDLPILTLTGAAAGIGSANSLGNVRNPLSSVELLPGARITTDSVMRINGMPSNSQSINIEGQDATNGFFKQQNQVNQAGVDAIQEVAIQTSNFAAEYGQSGGGYFNYTMKSGTNQLHGSAYDYFVNEVLNAGAPFTDAGISNPAKAGQHVRNPLRQNDYGFTLGGPVVIPKIYNGHNKTFFFFNFEQFRQSSFTSNSQAIVPTAAMRNGDFSAIPTSTCNTVSGQSVCFNQIFDPSTTTTVNGNVVRMPFSNNMVPQSRFDPTAVIIQNMIPTPNAPGLLDYVAPGYTNFRHTTIPSFKIDQAISDKIKLSGYYSAIKTDSPQTNGFAEPYTALQPQNALSQTIRVNLDYVLTPSLLLHFGAGLLYTSNPQTAPAYNQNQLFPQGLPFSDPNFFPYIAGQYSPIFGGFSGGGPYPAVANTGVAFTLTPNAWDTKPTFNSNLTWVKGNHTYKLGATALFEGIESVNASRADGQFGFSAVQTSDPIQNGLAFANTASSGFAYASFLLGDASSVSLAQVAHPRLGMHSYGLYIQDSWKVTRKLTFDYGLRWDYAILWKEQYGRMQNANFTAPNTEIGGKIGTVEYQATCHCNYANAYPYAIGPHLGVAYQINSKTVFRAGGAISYAATSDQAGLNSSAGDFYTVASPAYGAPAGLLKDGDPYAPGNRFGNTPVTWPDFNPLFPFPASQNPLVIPPSSPFVSIAPNAGRLPRTFQWSIGFQRELAKDIVVDVSYVGNRGAWWAAPLLAGLNYNALTPQGLLANRAYGATQGIDVTNRTDTALLNDQINNPAVLARYPLLANPNIVYPGFPGTSTLGQALRPYPQWNGVPPFLGPPMGDNWYDSLQIKGSKRLSRGLTAAVAYAWQKELTDGTDSNTSYVTPSPPLINDVFNIGQNKQIAGFSQPQTLTISYNYVTPRFSANGTALKALSWVSRDWTLGGVLSYRSGQIMQTPISANNLLANLQRGPANNPALWGGGYTFMNRVPGQPLFLVDPNSKFDPTTQLVLNPAAWTEPAYGTFGASPAYYNDFRWQRQPTENMSFGRTFSIKERYNVTIRAEFTNIFNRLYYSVPSNGAAFGAGPVFTTSPVGHGNSLSGTSGLLSSGFGYVPWVNGGSYNSLGTGPAPRSGQIVARFQF